MEQNFLLTYRLSGSIPTYTWFETSDDLINFIKNSDKIEVFEAIEVLASKKVNINID